MTSKQSTTNTTNNTSSNTTSSNTSSTSTKKCKEGLRIGILGSGKVGKTLADAFINEGHHVILAARNGDDIKLNEWIKDKSDNDKKLSSIGDFKKAVHDSDIILIVTAGLTTKSTIDQSGGENAFKNKIVIDATNPLDDKYNLIGSVGSGGGDLLQSIIPDAFVVKALNHVGYANMYKPVVNIQGVKPTSFICGNDTSAKHKVTDILNDFGWDVLDAGGIDSSFLLESMCLVWIRTALIRKDFNQAFGMLFTSPPSPPKYT